MPSSKFKTSRLAKIWSKSNYIKKFKTLIIFIIYYQLTQPNKLNYSFQEKSKLKSLMIYETPKEFRKQVINNNIY